MLERPPTTATNWRYRRKNLWPIFGWTGMRPCPTWTLFTEFRYWIRRKRLEIIVLVGVTINHLCKKIFQAFFLMSCRPFSVPVGQGRIPVHPKISQKFFLLCNQSGSVGAPSDFLLLGSECAHTYFSERKEEIVEMQSVNATHKNVIIILSREWLTSD